MNEKINIKPQTLPAFKRFCMTIGELPTSYVETMSYYEMILWFTKFLGEKVIPAVDNNAEALKEVQDLFLQLQDYVNRYFDELNVQNEINNKLDEMAESGELVEIISIYLESKAIIGFNTLSEMKEAENLVDGSICKTLGKTTYNDGRGFLYLIREKDESDIIDEDNIVSLSNQNLVAEKINQQIFDELNHEIDLINSEIDLINSNDTIFLGDSYAAGTTFESGSVQFLTSWCEYLRQLMGLTTGHYYIFSQGNAGFAKIGNNNMNFQMTLNSHLNEITNPNTIKNIIVCAGYNDWDEDTSLIRQRIREFISYCKTNFPNAQVYIGMIGGDSRDSSTGRLVRERLILRVLNAYNKCNEYGGIYLSGVENFTHNFYQFNEQGNHPNESGYKYVANMIYNAWKGGFATLNEPLTSVSIPSNFSSNITMQCVMSNNTKTLFIDDIVFNDANITASDIVSSTITLAPANTSNKLVKPTINLKLEVPVDIYILTPSNQKMHGAGKIRFAEDGKIQVRSTLFAFNQNITNIVIWPVVTTFNMLFS